MPTSKSSTMLTFKPSIKPSIDYLGVEYWAIRGDYTRAFVYRSTLSMRWLFTPLYFNLTTDESMQIHQFIQEREDFDVKKDRIDVSKTE